MRGDDLRADDLIVLLEVARSRAFAQAGLALGLDHTTVSRRITALERQVGDKLVDRSATGVELTAFGRELLPAAEQVETAMDLARRAVRPDHSISGHVRIAATEGFGVKVVAPVMARLHQRHPGITLELVTATRPLGQSTGVDIEIGVGTSANRRHEVVPLCDYHLGLYASDAYLAEHGPLTVATLPEHSLVYYIDSLQRVDVLGLPEPLTSAALRLASTNVLAHVETALAGGGIALVPEYLAEPVEGLRRVLVDVVRVRQSYVALLAPPTLQRPAAAVFMSELQREVARRRDEILGPEPGEGRSGG